LPDVKLSGPYAIDDFCALARQEKSKGGTVTPDNLGAICTNCNEGLQNIALPKPDRVWLLAQVRRATVDDQRALLHWLNQKVKS